AVPSVGVGRGHGNASSEEVRRQSLEPRRGGMRQPRNASVLTVRRSIRGHVGSGAKARDKLSFRLPPRAAGVECFMRRRGGLPLDSQQSARYRGGSLRREAHRVALASTETDMIERQWLTCTDPETLLKIVRGKMSERKLRLFACACARQVWHLLDEDPARRAVLLAEPIAEGLVPAREAPVLRPIQAPAGVREDSARAAARCVAAQACARKPDAELAALDAAAAVQFAAPHGERKAAWEAARRRQCDLIRDLLPDPTRAVV